MITHRYPQLPSSKEGCPSGRGGIEVITHRYPQLPSSKEGCPSGRGGIEVITHRYPQLPSSKEGCPSGRGGIEVITHRQVEPHKKTRARSCVYNQKQEQRLVFITRNKSKEFFYGHLAGGFILANHPTPNGAPLL